jgi:hypothetical protein
VIYDEQFHTVSTNPTMSKEAYMEKLHNTSARWLYKVEYTDEPCPFESLWDETHPTHTTRNPLILPGKANNLLLLRLPKGVPYHATCRNPTLRPPYKGALLNHTMVTHQTPTSPYKGAGYIYLVDLLTPGLLPPMTRRHYL